MKVQIEQSKLAKTIDVELEDREKSVVCPNCSGTGQDLSTMICVLCGGDGELSNEYSS